MNPEVGSHNRKRIRMQILQNVELNTFIMNQNADDQNHAEVISCSRIYLAMPFRLSEQVYFVDIKYEALSISKHLLLKVFSFSFFVCICLAPYPSLEPCLRCSIMLVACWMIIFWFEEILISLMGLLSLLWNHLWHFRYGGYWFYRLCMKTFKKMG